MINVQCKSCGIETLIDGGDVHDAMDAAGCTCCPVDHHHGRAAEGSTPCRPLVITLTGPVED